MPAVRFVSGSLVWISMYFISEHSNLQGMFLKIKIIKVYQASRHKACTVTFPHSALFFKSPQLQRSVVAVKPIFANVALSKLFIRTTVFEGWFHVLKRLVFYLTQWPSHLLSQRYRSKWKSTKGKTNRKPLWSPLKCSLNNILFALTPGTIFLLPGLLTSRQLGVVQLQSID